MPLIDKMPIKAAKLANNHQVEFCFRLVCNNPKTAKVANNSTKFSWYNRPLALTSGLYIEHIAVNARALLAPYSLLVSKYITAKQLKEMTSDNICNEIRDTPKMLNHTPIIVCHAAHLSSASTVEGVE